MLELCHLMKSNLEHELNIFASPSEAGDWEPGGRKSISALKKLFRYQL